MSFQSMIPDVGFTTTTVMAGLYILSLFLTSLSSRPPETAHDRNSLAEMPAVSGGADTGH